MATWRSALSKLRGAAVIGAILVAVAAGASVTPFLVCCESTVEAGSTPAEIARAERRREAAKRTKEFRERWEQGEREREERWKRLDAEYEARKQAADEEFAKALPPKRVRRVRRFQWESPAETRGRLWNVPEEETEEALLTALLRVCLAEADGRPQDCAGIWQVVKNNRRQECDRGMIRRITECDEGGGETYLSALRRHQRHVLGMIKARNKRAVWISKLTPDCEMPEGWTEGENLWDAHYGSKVCPQAVADARRLIAGKLPESRPGHRVRWLPGRPVTWGGRCEKNGGACDDRMACERVLARIPETDTLNAFWCRIGASGCRSDPEPVCLALGYQYDEVDRDGRTVWRLRTKQAEPADESEAPTPPEKTNTVTSISDSEGLDENS